MPGILRPDGSLDRQSVADVVFRDPEALADLNAIVHPAVGAEIDRRMEAERETDHVVVLDVPLLVESAAYETAGTIVVDTDPEVAVERLVRYRGFTEADARARMARQAHRERATGRGGLRDHQRRDARRARPAARCVLGLDRGAPGYRPPLRPRGGSADPSPMTWSAAVATEATPGCDGSDAAAPRAGPRWTDAVGLAAVQAVVGLVYVVLGPGFVLDDWFALANAHFDGWWAAAGTVQWGSRPGAGVVYSVVFGVLGPHPLVVELLLTVLAVATVVVLYVAAARLVGRRGAVVLCVVWSVLPNHTSLEVWASASNIAVALLLVLVAVVVLTERPSVGGDVAVAALVGASALCYEATIPFAVLASLAVPPLAGWGARRSAVVATTLSSGLAGVWIVLHWNASKAVTSGFVDVSSAVPGHFGWGVAPAGPASSVLLAATLTGIVWALGRLLVSSDRSVMRAEWLVVGGLAVIGVGVLPFVRYGYMPLGFGDRVTVVSSLGGAAVYAGLILLLASRREVLGAVALAVLVSLGAIARAHRAVLWTDAGHDAVSILDRVSAVSGGPGTGPVVLGPHPVVEGNVAAFLDRSNIESALELRWGVRGADAHVRAATGRLRGLAGGARGHRGGLVPHRRPGLTRSPAACRGRCRSPFVDSGHAPVPHGLGVRARRRPAPGHPRARREHRGRQPLPDPARHHRLGQERHRGVDHPGGAAAHAGDRAQQVARRAARQRVPGVLPREPGGVLRLLLRLLPARGLHAGHATPTSRRTRR